jgi:hypothetical protein
VKCIRCDKDSNYPERQNKRCPHCKREFAFEPRTGDPFSDAAFANAIKRVSSDGGVRWGVEHLYYELARLKRHGPGTAGFLAVFTIVASVIAGAAAHYLVGVLLFVILSAVAIRSWTKQRPIQFARAEFEPLWQRWRTTHGEPKGLIVRKTANPDAPARVIEPDIEHYSFDRAVICDRARTVDLLLANNFHFENNCAVLSLGGYPERAFAAVRRMLKQNPRLMVFALHDATPEGCAMAHALAADPDWFKGVGKVVDVGLRPAHAESLRGLWVPRREHEVFSHQPGILPHEVKWLTSWTVELAAVRPEQVIKRLFRAISAYPEGADTSGGDGGGVEVVDVVYFSTDTGASDGGGDSFG